MAEEEDLARMVATDLADDLRPDRAPGPGHKDGLALELLDQTSLVELDLLTTEQVFDLNGPRLA